MKAALTRLSAVAALALSLTACGNSATEVTPSDNMPPGTTLTRVHHYSTVCYVVTRDTGAVAVSCR